MFFFKKNGKIKIKKEIDPDEIFLDSQNLPGFDTDQFEGRLEKPISRKLIWIFGIFFCLVLIVFFFQISNLQIRQGQAFAEQSERNRLRNSIVFADRGIIYDIKNVPLAWNNPSTDDDFSKRKYIEIPGFSNLLGYITYPKKDSAGFYFEEDIRGIDGIELIYDDFLRGQNGSEIVETNALNQKISQSTTKRPQTGGNINLTIDKDVQEHLYKSIVKTAEERGFSGGAGVIIDIWTGEILAMVTYPEYDSNVLSDGSDKEKIDFFVRNNRNPFLNRVSDGLYTPGSVVKPFIAIAALAEKIIDPQKQILSTKRMIVPNPYNPDNPSFFSDWKAHGMVDMYRALAVSSNIYFYQIGGGYDGQRGLGITNINKYLSMFGFGEVINSKDFKKISGIVPNPDWKKRNFDDDWRLGDTYFTAIGQYGFQTTPLQLAVAVSALANEGTVVEPRLIFDSKMTNNIRRKIPIDSKDFKIVKRGMREAVTSGTAIGLNYSDFQIAAKTGTAELGESKERVNSWITGFFPYENPRYAFVIVLESGEVSNLVGGVATARNFFDWLKYNKPEYLD
ncbi:MAG TPA: penicillin-binding transpeptidase domain-containing protein [Candidatus Paceibacterota bacterium]|nr:penicillin-binding transpeptidase domain-containing protein [Candidatus Paceibacterota bacterium]HMP18860.1 penicillin-binding transpeptidase domain-containing protein [Candidatus Paceibacterota bacterium]HMP85176.1 penicillin-binding transpeptidase domain-containing protein [Candidatus Paceibacterota bacterium]